MSAGAMGVPELIVTCGHVVRVLRAGAEIVEDVDPAHATAWRAAAKVLERQAADALSSPPDETPPHGLFLVELSRALDEIDEWVPPETTRHVVRLARRALPLMRKLLVAVEVYGADAELVGEAQQWLEDAYKDPGLP